MPFLLRACVYAINIDIDIDIDIAMHLFHFTGTLRVCILYLSFLAFAFIFLPPFFLSLLPCFVFYAFVGALLTFLSSFPVQQTTYRIDNRVYFIFLGKVEIRLINVKDTNRHTHICALFPWCRHSKCLAFLYTGALKQEQGGPQELSRLNFSNLRLDLRN